MPRPSPVPARPSLGLMLAWTCLLLAPAARAGDPEPVRFNTEFEGGSLGSVERTGGGSFRCRVQGQQDEHGRNRQASWYYFRIDGVRGGDPTLTLTDFVGEYDGKPGACPTGPEIVPVYSDDGEHWRGVPEVTWDDRRKEATVTLRPERDAVWVAHQPPYTPRRLNCSLGDLRPRCVKNLVADFTTIFPDLVPERNRTTGIVLRGIAVGLHLPMIWLLNRFRKGDASSREFKGLTGRDGLTALNMPRKIDLSAT